MVPHAKRNSHCSYCGAWFLDQAPGEKKCVVCEQVTYSNPLPVSVSLIRAKLETWDQIGIVIVKRNIPPSKGEWALPGGYLVTGESWKEGSAREVREETNIILNPDDIKTFDVATGTNGNLLIFSSYDKVIDWKEDSFVPNDEVSAIDLCWLPTTLAFPSHTLYLRKYLQLINGVDYEFGR